MSNSSAPAKLAFCCWLALACLPAPAAPPEPAAPSPLSPFGVGSCYINNRSAEDNARWIPQMAEIGIRAYRTPHTDWGALETNKGEWNWRTLDEQMKYLEKYTLEFGAILIGSPKWNTLDKPGYMPVNNVAGWSNYVTELAKTPQGPRAPLRGLERAA